MDSWYLEALVCPIDHLPLKYTDGCLLSSAGRKYPVVDGIPVMLVDGVEQTHWAVPASLKRAQGDPEAIDQRAPHLYLESLGINGREKEGIIELAKGKELAVDPVVSYLVGATSGNTYAHLVGKLKSYPIPDLRLPSTDGESFLELGCNWGRWCIAAARQGYEAVGIDPSLGAVMAARRVAREMGLQIKYLVADGRYLPFRESKFKVVFSYSVLQHLSKSDARAVLAAASRVLRPGGTSRIQMPNAWGVRSLQNQIQRRFRTAQGFEVRYWTPPELKKTFREIIGDTALSVDCYFGLGLQYADIGHMPLRLRLVIRASEFLRRASDYLRPLKYLADSLYLESVKSSSGSASTAARGSLGSPGRPSAELEAN